MPTIRSQYTLEQLERELQKMAHELPRFLHVRAHNFSMDFFYDSNGTIKKIRVGYAKPTGTMKYPGTSYEFPVYDQWGFTAESKLYYTSSDVTRLSIGNQEDAKRIVDWIKETMGSAPIEPRFSLQHHMKAKQETTHDECSTAPSS